MVPLVVRSHHSLLWGTAAPVDICRHARRLGYRQLALTDTDNLYGLWPFLRACRHEGITPIVGAEVTEAKSSRRAVCLVANTAGYANLCRILTRRHSDSAFQLETALAEMGNGLIVLTGSTRLLMAGHAAGRTVAAAMPRRPLPRAHPLRRCAQRLGVPVVATSSSFYLNPGEASIHQLLRAIDGRVPISKLSARNVAPDDAWLAGPARYQRRFAPCPQAIAATETIASQIEFRGPRFGIVMPPWQPANGLDADSELRAAAYRGARQRYDEELPEPVVERLQHELGIIAQMGFATYFLTVRSIIAHSPRICGRGSGAASLVAYCLGITNVCPLRHNLYFARFLNPGRTDPPDIDVDFAWDERDQVIEKVLQRFSGHAAMVASHVLFQPRMAIRETARVFGLTDREIGLVTKRLPWHWRMSESTADLLHAVRTQPELSDLDFPPPWPQILANARALTGMPRHLSVHPGGVVITPEPIHHYAPVQIAPKGVPVLQWEKEAVEESGLVKIDLLGNRSLGVIRDAVANIQANGHLLEEQHWQPEDDLETQQSVAQGNTMGCFYIESPAMRLLQQKAGVGDFDHLVIHSSIIRPAANEFIREYVRRLHGGRWQPLHPLLSDVLSETFGIMVYQEDVSRAAEMLAGFSSVEADALRKVMSKKDRAHRLEDFRRNFVAGAHAKGLHREQINQIWQMMMSFSGYSFCKPHSASYARVSFQAAYLKTHHCAEFMAAVISNGGGFYSTFAYVSEARRMGLTIDAPDVNQSHRTWRGRNNKLKVGLMAIAGLSNATIEKIEQQRGARGYQNLNDFLNRVHPDEGEARHLIYSGALDRFAPNGHRGILLWQLAAWRRGDRITGRRTRQRMLKFGPSTPPPMPALPPEAPHERIRREFSALGFLCHQHPMQLYAPMRPKLGAMPIGQIGKGRRQRVRLMAWLITGKVVHTRKGDPMQFLTFEDETGIVETTFFPEAYRRFCHMVDLGRPYLLQGSIEEDWGARTVCVDRVQPLPAIRQWTSPPAR